MLGLTEASPLRHAVLIWPWWPRPYCMPGALLAPHDISPPFSEQLAHELPQTYLTRPRVAFYISAYLCYLKLKYEINWELKYGINLDCNYILLDPMERAQPLASRGMKSGGCTRPLVRWICLAPRRVLEQMRRPPLLMLVAGWCWPFATPEGPILGLPVQLEPHDVWVSPSGWTRTAATNWAACASSAPPAGQGNLALLLAGAPLPAPPMMATWWP
jgi:hypothetical protein